MSRRRLNNRNIRKLTRTGRGASVSLTIPIEIIRKLRWKGKQKGVVTQKGQKITIEDWKK
jgi:hypothetical protein